MKTYLLAYFATAIVFLGLDSIWLSLMSGALYRPLLGNLLLAKFHLAPAAAFYVLYVAGIVIFVLTPAFGSGRWTTALVYGALFGLFAYATYDLTNQATLKNWPPLITFADICWGVTLTAVSATLGYVITNAILKVTHSG